MSKKYLKGFKAFSNVKKGKKSGFGSSNFSQSVGSIPEGKYFGKPIDPNDVSSVPKFLIEMMGYLQEESNITKPEIFSRKGEKENLDDVFNVLNDPEEDDLELKEIIDGMGGNVYTVADLVMEYFRLLPDPLLTYRLYDDWIGCFSKNQEEMRKKIEVVFQTKLEKANLEICKHLFLLLCNVNRFSKVNNMNSERLSIEFAPLILRPKELNIKKFKDAGMVCNMIKLVIENPDILQI